MFLCLPARLTDKNSLGQHLSKCLFHNRPLFSVGCVQYFTTKPVVHPHRLLYKGALFIHPFRPLARDVIATERGEQDFVWEQHFLWWPRCVDQGGRAESSDKPCTAEPETRGEEQKDTMSFLFQCFATPAHTIKRD